MGDKMKREHLDFIEMTRDGQNDYPWKYTTVVRHDTRSYYYRNKPDIVIKAWQEANTGDDYKEIDTQEHDNGEFTVTIT